MTEAKPQAEAAVPPQRSAPDPLPAAEAAFASGEYARLRRLLVELARSDSAEARARGAELARAIGVDPALLAVLLACLLGFGVVFVHYVLT